MKKRYLIIAGLFTAFAIGYFLNTVFAQKPNNNTETTKTEKQNNMKLGAFSISLSVKDLKTSKEFYEKLGFNAFAGSWFGIFKTRSIAKHPIWRRVATIENCN